MNRAFLFVVSLLAFLPLIHIPNPGYDALLMPFNIFLWEACALTIFFASLYIFKNKTITLPEYAAWFLVLPLGITLSNFLTGFNYPTDILFRMIAILMGLLFFFALFQFQPSKRTLDNALYILLTGLLLNAIVGVVQMMPGYPLLGLIPHVLEQVPVGYFMQPNVLASAMVTAILISVYLISAPSFSSRSSILKSLCYLSILACSLIVFAAGSRIGLLSLAIALPIMLASRWRILRQFRQRVLLAAFALFLGIGAGYGMSDGLVKAYGKLERLQNGTGARIHMYAISWDLFTDRPLAGFGIGNFQSEFREKAAEYLEARGGIPRIGDERFSHPHNELLFWAIEGGILALIGIFTVAAVTLRKIWKLGWQRGGALFALLLPIALHTQTELPFYSSVYHWLLFLFLVFIVFQSGKHYIFFKKSAKLLIGLPAAGICLLVATLNFGTTTFTTGRSLARFLMYNEFNPEELEKAQQTIYFNEFATLLSLKAYLTRDLIHGTHEWTPTYIAWAEKYIQKIPETSSFHDLALAYNHEGQRDKALAIIERGLYLYPKQSVILSALEKIQRIPKTDIESELDKILTPNTITASAASKKKMLPFLLNKGS